MKKIKFKFAALIFCFLTANSFAAEFFITGAGTLSCGKYINFRNEKNQTMNDFVVSWQQGYLSAANVVNIIKEKKWAPVPDTETIHLMNEKFCIANPLKNISDSSLNIYLNLTWKKAQ